MSTTAIDELQRVVAKMTPIGLDELVKTADLQTRKDRKYLVPLVDVPTLVDYLPDDSRVLSIDGRTRFGYRSDYFDTADLRSYLGATRRRSSRFKVRVRTYVDSDVSRLEVKTRDRRGRTVKHRSPVESNQAVALTASGREFIAGVEQAGDAAWDLEPSLSTTYQRSTILLRGETARVTVDTCVHWYDTDGRKLELGAYAIVETKTAGRPTSLDRALWKVGHRPATFSKYCTGLAAFRPDLPSNRWHRALQRYLGC